MRKRSLLFFVLALLLVIAGRLYPPPLQKGVSVSKAIFDRQERLLRLTLSHDEKYRVWLPLASISPAIVEATLAEEDRFFYWHPGFNPLSLVRAFVHTYVQKTKRIGGSTLTMQLARLRYRINTKSPWGKLKQLGYAVRLELGYSKRDLLEAYLNLAPYGLNIEGVGAASLIYFRKNCHQVSTAEALFLVALPQSPSIRSPKENGDHPNLGAGRSYVKTKLVKQWIRRHPQQAAQENDLLRPLPLYLPKELPFDAPHFTDEMSARYPDRSTLVTTIDSKIQKNLKRQVELFITGRKAKGLTNAAALVVNYHSMEVLGVMGSAAYWNAEIQGQVNGTLAKRSPGSTLKPLVYGMAIDQGLIHPLTLLKDSPRRYGTLNPENSDYDFLGPISATTALNMSRNLPALKLAGELSPNLYQFLASARIPLPHEEAYYGLGLVLGGAELTMEELVTLYGVIAGDGKLRPLRKLRDEALVPAKSQLSEGAAYIVKEMLKQNIPPGRESLRRILSNERAVAWKTGTSHGFKDAWAIGISDPYVVAVWVGDFQGESNPAFMGRESAAPLFFQIIESLPPAPHSFGYFPPKEVVPVKVCEVSGGLPGPHCRHTKETWFIPGKSPFQTCGVHRGLLIHNRTGFRTCERFHHEARLEAFEVWDSELLRLFRQAGIPRHQVPPLDPRCRFQPPSGTPPEITSPAPNIAYAIRLTKNNTNKIPLIATMEGGKRTLYWFANEKFLGKVFNAEPLFWDARPGHYVVRVVDDFGQAAARDLVVTAVN